MEKIPVIYIVDDNAAARDSVADMVESKGLSARVYGSAKEFLKEFDRNDLACLLTDVRMPGMNGLELQNTLRAEGCNMPVIVITGYGDVPTAVSAFRGGAVAFLEKPCDARELWSHISKALEEYKLRRSEEERKNEIIARFNALTESERSVMEAMVDGKPNKVIASELLLGLRTVELRRANILKKTKAKSLADLVRMCVLYNMSSEEKSGMADKFRADEFRADEFKGCFG